jgi:hypothetical protein
MDQLNNLNSLNMFNFGAPQNNNILNLNTQEVKIETKALAKERSEQKINTDAGDNNINRNNKLNSKTEATKRDDKVSKKEDVSADGEVKERFKLKEDVDDEDKSSVKEIEASDEDLNSLILQMLGVAQLNEDNELTLKDLSQLLETETGHLEDLSLINNLSNDEASPEQADLINAVISSKQLFSLGEETGLDETAQLKLPEFTETEFDSETLAHIDKMVEGLNEGLDFSELKDKVLSSLENKQNAINKEILKVNIKDFDKVLTLAKQSEALEALKQNVVETVSLSLPSLAADENVKLDAKFEQLDSMLSDKLDEIFSELEITVDVDTQTGEQSFSESETGAENFELMFNARASNVKFNPGSSSKGTEQKIDVKNLIKTIPEYASKVPAGGKQEIRFMLNPENLGKIEVNISKNMTNNLSLELKVSNDVTDKILKQKINEFVASLNDKGVSLDEITVTKSEEGMMSGKDQNREQTTSEQDSAEEQQRKKLRQQFKNNTASNDTLFDSSLRNFL